MKSVLDDIPGIGPARRRALIRHFKSLDAVMDADMDALLRVPEMNRRAAEAVIEFFSEKKNEAFPGEAGPDGQEDEGST